MLVEVMRYLAAKMVVEGSAQLVGARGRLQTFAGMAMKAAREAAASRFEVSKMVPSEELKRLNDDVRKLKNGAKAGKD